MIITIIPRFVVYKLSGLWIILTNKFHFAVVCSIEMHMWRHNYVDTGCDIFCPSRTKQRKEKNGI